MKNILLLLLPILSACIAEPDINKTVSVSHNTNEATEQEILDYDAEMKRLDDEEKRFTKQANKDEETLKDIAENQNAEARAKRADNLKRAKKRVLDAKKRAEQNRNALVTLEKKPSDNLSSLPVQKKTSNSFRFIKVFRDRLKDSTKGPQMVWIAGGSFKMGSNNGEDDEKPVHTVKIDRFAMGKYEVTFAEYDKFTNATGRKKSDDEGWGRGNLPVINVSWNDATAYAKWLSDQTGHTYRLPTEAEWEYAARAGTTTKYWWGDSIGANKANCGSDCGDSFKYTAPVGSFAANSWGLHDTAGNVWEWVQDWYGSSYYSSRPPNNPTGPSTGRYRVLRGGCWFNGASYVRTAFRDRSRPGSRGNNLGFRLYRTRF